MGNMKKRIKEILTIMTTVLAILSMTNSADAQLRKNEKKIVKIFKESSKKHNRKEGKVTGVSKRRYGYYTEAYSSGSDDDVSRSFWVGAIIGYVAVTGGLYATDTRPIAGAKVIDGMIGLPIGGLVGEWINPNESPINYDPEECYHYGSFSDFAYNVGKVYILTRLHENYSGDRPVVTGCEKYVERLTSKGLGLYFEENDYFTIVQLRVENRVVKDFGDEITRLPVHREIEKAHFRDIEKWFERSIQ